MSFWRGWATVTYEDGKTLVEQMVAAINKSGFRASVPAVK